jgi:hypothetical protein
VEAYYALRLVREWALTLDYQGVRIWLTTATAGRFPWSPSVYIGRGEHVTVMCRGCRE